MREPTTGDFLVERIMHILVRLHNKEHLSKAELALEYGVSERTIQRDIKERLVHLPIQKDNSGRYYLADNSMLKSYKKELEHLLKSLIGGGCFTDKEIEKIINFSYFPIKFQPINDFGGLSKFFLLCKAIVEQKIIKATYKGKARKLKPYKLINHLSVWYLLATHNDEIRTFSLHKLRAISLSDDEFIHDEKILRRIEDGEEFFLSASFTKEITLEISGFAMEYFLERKILANQEIISKDKDKLILSTKISLDEELLSTIWQFIPYVKILSPKDLALKNEKLIKEYLKHLRT